MLSILANGWICLYRRQIMNRYTVKAKALTRKIPAWLVEECGLDAVNGSG